MLHSYLAGGALSLALSLFGLSAWGQRSEASVRPATEAPDLYIWSREMQERLFSLSVRMDSKILVNAAACQSVAQLRPLGVAVLEPLVFRDGGAHPVRGTWIARYIFQRCGESVTYNGFFAANADEAPTLYEFPPGTTRATPELIYDLNAALLSAADDVNGERHRGCAEFVITDTNVTVEPRAMRIGRDVVPGVWEEKWRARTCAGAFEKLFCFIPEHWGATTWVGQKCDPNLLAAPRR